jgi:hypothetical protein
MAGRPPHSVLLNPDQNVKAGCAILRQLLDYYHGDLTKSLAAYELGQVAVDPYGSGGPTAGVYLARFGTAWEALWPDPCPIGSGVVTPPPPVRPLPADEPAGNIAFLQQKVRYWTEKYTRCVETGNAEYDPDYGKAILYSLVDRTKGLMYRAERLAAGGAMGPTAFSQRDPRWAEDPLGMAGSTTIGLAGCLITAVASGLCDLGIPTNPAMLNCWLSQHRGFGQGNLFIWPSVERLEVKLDQYVECPKVDAPMGMIRRALADGKVAIVELDSVPGGDVQPHFARVLAVSEDAKDCDLMDPWQLPGGEFCKLSAHYAAAGWNAARAIFAVGIYRKA